MLDKVTSEFDMPPVVAPEAPQFVKDVVAPIMARRGNQLPVSSFPVDGTYPSATTQWEKRNIALEIPAWDPGDMHPMRQVRLLLPARGHPPQDL